MTTRTLRVAVVASGNDRSPADALATRLRHELRAAGHDVEPDSGRRATTGADRAGPADVVVVCTGPGGVPGVGAQSLARTYGVGATVVLLEHLGSALPPGSRRALAGALSASVSEVAGRLEVTAPAAPATALLHELLRPTRLDLVIAATLPVAS